MKHTTAGLRSLGPTRAWGAVLVCPVDDDVLANTQEPVTMDPVHQARFMMNRNNASTRLEPTGPADARVGEPAPELVLITHAQGDHLSPKTMAALDPTDAVGVMPMSIAETRPRMRSWASGDGQRR